MLSAANVRWDSFLFNFEQHYKVMKEAEKKDLLDILKLTNSTSVSKWVEPMVVHTTQVHCSRGRTLAYLAHPHVNVAVDVPDLEGGQPHSVLHGSIKSDMTH